MKDHELLLVPSGVSVSSSNNDSSNGSKITNIELGQAETQTDSTKRTWTRITRMEVGPLERRLTTHLSKLGNRQMEDALEKNGEAESTSLHLKRSRVSGGHGFSKSISAGEKDHP